MGTFKISDELKDTGLKQIRPNKDKNKGINLVYLASVTLKSKEIKGDSNMLEYRGLTIPAIEFIWNQRMENKDEEPCKFIETFMPTSKSITGEYFDNLLMQQVKHILHILRAYKTLTDEDYKALNVFEEDFDATDGDAMIALFSKFYMGVYNIICPTVKVDKKDVTKPLFMTDKNEYRLAWLKLVYNIKMKRFGLPTSNSAFYELYIKDKPTSLFIDVLKKETIEVPTTTEAANVIRATPPGVLEQGKGNDFTENLPAGFMS